MINLTTERMSGDDTWYGVAWAGGDIVATTVSTTREWALANLRRCIPRNVAARIADTDPSFVSATLGMMAELERGVEAEKHFTLATEYVSEPMRRIYSVAAMIPRGYVTTYGNIAEASGSEARAVGRAMATNPLYPIVPCHRVVGADMSLIGYGGKQDREALEAKLGRIRAEACGHRHESGVPLAKGTLTVYPGEWVLWKAEADEERERTLRKRRAETAALERMQLRLF